MLDIVLDMNIKDGKLLDEFEKFTSIKSDEIVDDLLNKLNI